MNLSLHHRACLLACRICLHHNFAFFYTNGLFECTAYHFQIVLKTNVHPALKYRGKEVYTVSDTSQSLERLEKLIGQLIEETNNS